MVSGCSTTTNIQADNESIDAFKANKEFVNETLTETQKEVVYKYAPIIFQQTNTSKGGKPMTWDCYIL
jgi:hypothetical protein